MATTCFSATATRCSAHTSSTAEATRRWGPPGAISTSRRSAVRRLGRTRRRVTLRPKRTSGGTGTTTTTPSQRLTRSGWIYSPILRGPPSEGAKKRRKRAKEGRDSRRRPQKSGAALYPRWPRIRFHSDELVVYPRSGGIFHGRPVGPARHGQDLSLDRSCEDRADAHTGERMLADTEEMAAWARHEFRQDKIGAVRLSVFPQRRSRHDWR